MRFEGTLDILFPLPAGGVVFSDVSGLVADTNSFTIDDILWVPRVHADEHLCVRILVDLIDDGRDSSGFFRSSGQRLSNLFRNGSGIFAKTGIGSEFELLFDEIGCGLEALTDLVPASASFSQKHHTVHLIEVSDLTELQVEACKLFETARGQLFSSGSHSVVC